MAIDLNALAILKAIDHKTFENILTAAQLTIRTMKSRIHGCDGSKYSGNGVNRIWMELCSSGDPYRTDGAQLRKADSIKLYHWRGLFSAAVGRSARSTPME
jgi:hypothetical protein